MDNSAAAVVGQWFDLVRCGLTSPVIIVFVDGSILLPPIGCPSCPQVTALVTPLDADPDNRVDIGDANWCIAVKLEGGWTELSSERQDVRISRKDVSCLLHFVLLFKINMSERERQRERDLNVNIDYRCDGKCRFWYHCTSVGAVCHWIRT